MKMTNVTVVGGGLAGCEAAWQLAKRGLHVSLYEMRPIQSTGAHVTSDLAELVCSNSFGSVQIDRASGLLKQELHLLDSFLLECAEKTAIPAGGALAVDRQAFSKLVSQCIEQNPNIQVIRDEIIDVPDGPAVIASGPLTSNNLANAIQEITGMKRLFFFDAVAPIVLTDSVDMSIAYRGSRFENSSLPGGDYINCPLNEIEYDTFLDALTSANCMKLKEFETEIEHGVRAGCVDYFEGCLPIEIQARRGRLSLAYGPLRPIGLFNPHTGKRPYAVVQLRQDNYAATLYNMVGFQTNLTFAEQERVFRMIPGLSEANFVRYGQMHRNTFIYSPALLNPTLQFRDRGELYFAGQIIGVEGYVGNIATGLLAGINLGRVILGSAPVCLPESTMIGALCKYVTQAMEQDFQPMKANFGLLPPLDVSPKLDRRERCRLLSERALSDLRQAIQPLEIQRNAHR